MATTLFTAGKIGTLTLPNRLIRSATQDPFGHRDGTCDAQQVELYRQIAAAGTGAIITAYSYISPEARSTGIQVGFATPEQRASQKEVLDAVHQAGGRLILQLMHAGLNVYMSEKHVVGGKLLAPSGGMKGANEMETTDITPADMDKIRADFVDAAKAAKEMGFDGIQLHCAHGYLLSQFLDPNTNHRTDEYGGDLENRLRCAREILEGVKAACGPDFVVSMRLALKSYIKGYNQPSLHGEDEVGRTLEEGLEIARRLEAYGYDCLSVDFGQYDSFYYAAPPCYMEKGRVIDLAAACKQVVSIPVLCGGRMNDPALAAQAIADGKLDAIVLGRPSLADPAYAQKVAMGCPEDIRPCIGCNQGCIGALKAGRRAGCAVNPQAAREATFALTPALEKKTVLVVGGGVAGMEAARCAALRGHAVTLCEAGEKLGGNLIPAGAHDFKAELAELNAWYQRQLAKLGVTVETGTALSAQDILARKPDAVVLAMGAVPAVPPVPGIQDEKVVDCVTALTGPALAGEAILVVGGGLVGCETALGFAQQGKKVTLVEALPDILSAGIPVPEMNSSMLRDLLDEAGVTIRTRCRLARITPAGAVVQGPEGETELSAQHVVLAVGFRPRPSLADQLAGQGIAVYQVGDGEKVGSVMTAIGTAYTVGRQL